VVGDPVGHSLSPLVHNRAFRDANINAVYVPFRVPRGELATFLKECEFLPVEGYSVTIPHKEEAADLADHKDETVYRIKAANTLVRGEDGFTAYNTDYQGCLDALNAHLAANPPKPPEGSTAQPPPETLASKSVLLLGAGGIARAVAAALHDAKAGVAIANRTFDKAQRLADQIGCRSIDWGARHTLVADIIVNCTSVGMHPNVDETPMHQSFFSPATLVFDTVYTPETTLLIKEARGRGAPTLTGVELFVRQAALQFQLFTGQPGDVDRMRAMVKRALSPVAIREEEEQ
jgi:3-dehydroquinate dehydratase/shikimate dehydrogenase